MAKSAEHVVNNGKAAFYACIWPDIKEAALKCGWALGLHGSLSNDMDIMAMPWVEDCSSELVLIQSISDCFIGCPFKKDHTVPYYGNAHGRVVYTISVWSDFYLDINIIRNNN